MRTMRVLLCLLVVSCWSSCLGSTSSSCQAFSFFTVSRSRRKGLGLIRTTRTIATPTFVRNAQEGFTYRSTSTKYDGTFSGSSILGKEDKESSSSSLVTPRTTSFEAWARGVEVLSTVMQDVGLPVLFSAVRMGGKLDWDELWSSPCRPSSSSNSVTNATTHGQNLVAALEKLGPTYVKVGQALAFRPDLVPATLAEDLYKLQDKMNPTFDTNVARQIIAEELQQQHDVQPQVLQSLLNSLSETPVAAASIGQVYKAHVEGYGDVAVKIQRPEVRNMVERDKMFLKKGAELVASIPSLSIMMNDKKKHNRLIATDIVAAVDEFMTRVEEELDYENEAANSRKFRQLYASSSSRNRRHSSINNNNVNNNIVVPEILDHMCTKNVLVMEWINGTKLTTIASERDTDSVEENLDLIETGIECTLSQLLEFGVLHADTHPGNLLKVTVMKNNRKDGKTKKASRPTLAYIDFGIVSTVPERVRDGLISAVAVLIFKRDVEKVADLFSELQILPQEVLDDPVERVAFYQALNDTVKQFLDYGDDDDDDSREDIDEGTTRVPMLRFDRLLRGMIRLIPRFQIQAPPYSLNNARALATLEGMARTLDPKFNVLHSLYPVALQGLIRNKRKSPIVDATFRNLITDPETGRVDPKMVSKLLRDISSVTGRSKRRVVLDVLQTNGTLRLARRLVREQAQRDDYANDQDGLRTLSDRKRQRVRGFLQL